MDLTSIQLVLPRGTSYKSRYCEGEVRAAFAPMNAWVSFVASAVSVLVG